MDGFEIASSIRQNEKRKVIIEQLKAELESKQLHIDYLLNKPCIGRPKPSWCSYDSRVKIRVLADVFVIIACVAWIIGLVVSMERDRHKAEGHQCTETHEHKKVEKLAK